MGEGTSHLENHGIFPLKSPTNAILIFILQLMLAFPVGAEITIKQGNDFIFTATPYLRVDSVTINNTVNLDNKMRDDSTSYLGLDYSLGLDLKRKESGAEFYLKFERNGPYDYDAPLFIQNTLMTSTGPVEKYRNSKLFPQLEEFWSDLPLFTFPVKIKSGLFSYEVGHGIAVGGSYENYGLALHNKTDNYGWNFYYCYPDIANKGHGGPHIDQEKGEGINYEHSKANFFGLDVTLTAGNNTFQPYLAVLLDRTGDKRSNAFSTPTHDDTLGTVGIAWDLNAEKWFIGAETARNFGKAKSSDANFKDVAHQGYIFYAQGGYHFDRITPRSRFVLASGNKVALDQYADETLTSGKNRGFSVYSPLNTNLADAIYPTAEQVPLVALGGGYGLNYGVNRPGTFGDPRVFENLIMPNIGFDFKLTNRLSMSVDWWYLMSMEKGVGVVGGDAKRLSAELGNEIDTNFSYALNEKVTLDLSAGYFFPGRYYREAREDTTGSLFSPAVRADGEADGAYQIEGAITFAF